MRRWLLSPVPYGLWLGTCLMIGVLFAGGFWLYTRIQDSRTGATVAACRETNNRNRATIRQFHVELDAALRREKDPARRRQINASVAANIRLINAIVPVQKNCVAFAKHRVTQKVPPPP